MAQPTRSDDQVVRRRLSHNNLRRKKWRRRQPRAERKRPRRSGSFSALTFGVLVEHPIFLSRVFSPSPQVAAHPTHIMRSGQPTKRGRRNAGPTCQAAECAGGRTTPQSTSEGRNPQNGEEGEGRKEEGGEEKVRSLLGEKGDASASPFLCTATAMSSRPRSARGESRPPAECDRRARCRSRRVRTRCSGRQGAVAASV
jgi:hypothetical protein